MKLYTNKSLLSEAISMAQKAIAVHSPNALLQGLFLDAKSDNSLTIIGYDLETGIESRLNCEVEEAGQLVVNAKMFGDIIRKLPDEQVFLKSDAQLNLEIQSAHSKFKIRGMEAIDFPKFPVVEASQQLTLPQNLFCEMVQQTLFACSTDESRPVLNGIYVETEGQRLNFVAIDGFRMALRTEVFDEKIEPLHFIVPLKTMNDAARILDNSSSEPVSIYPSHNHVLIDTGRVRMVSRLIQGDFMDYRKVIPAAYLSEMEMNSRDLLEAIDRASLIINVEQRRFPVTFKNLANQTFLIHAETDLGTVHEELPIQMSGEDIDVDFNPKYFMDVLRNLKEQPVKLQFTGKSGTCVMSPVEGQNFLYMILPLRR